MSDEPQTRVALFLTKGDAEALSFAISDILCWCAGFEAGRAGTDLEGGPLGTNRLRDFNIRLKSEL